MVDRLGILRNEESTEANVDGACNRWPGKKADEKESGWPIGTSTGGRSTGGRLRTAAGI